MLTYRGRYPDYSECLSEGDDIDLCVARQCDCFETDNTQKTVKEVLLKGKVVDEKGAATGVTILVKGTSVGAVTDANGQFAMRVPETANLALVFSFIGMEPKEVAYKGQQEFYVVMKTAKEELEEVVVTGYMKLKKESFTGNTTTVNKDQLLKTNNKKRYCCSAGFEPSFRIKDNKLFGSDPNSLPEFTIRGEGSIGMNRGLKWKKPDVRKELL